MGKTSFHFLIGLVAFVAVMLTGVAVAQDPLKFTALTSMDGLSSNTVSAILRDRYGLMWFATDDGLNKFDGTEFTVYRHNKKDPASLGSNEVSALHEDRAGRLWVGTVEGSLHLYDRKRDSFIHIKTDQSVTAIFSDHKNRLWVGTAVGLVVIDPTTYKISTFQTAPGVPPDVSEKHILSLFEDSKKQMWVGTLKGLYRFDAKTKHFESVTYELPVSEGTGKSAVKTIKEDKLGNLWIGTSNGLSMLSGNRLQTFRYRRDDDNSISSNVIYAIAAENSEKLWICTESGLDLMDIRSGKVVRYKPDPRTLFSLTNKSVRSILIDREGIFWLGTYKGGVNKYDKNLTIFGLKRSDPYDPFGLSAPFVTSFAENENGDLFVGTDGGGLNLYHRKTNLFTKYPINPRNKIASSGLAILSLEMGSDNKLWIGTFQDGLFSLNPATGTYEQFTRGTGPLFLSSNDVFCLKTDRTGKLWIGTNGGGVNVYDPAKNQFISYFDPNKTRLKQTIPLNAYIRAIEEDRQGNIWIGSFGTGIAVFDPQKQTSTVYNKANSGLPGNKILTILEDRKGNVWVGTNGGGLALFNKRTRKFSVFADKEGLPSGIVHKILEDAQGRIWVSTNQGVSYLDLSKRQFINYTTYNGLQNNTFVLGAGLRTSDNILFFGGIEGFNFLDTRTLKINNNIAPVILKDLKVGNRNVTPADSAIISEHISIAKSINLDYKQNFSIGYTALNYTNPKQTLYRYRLLGFEQEWYDAGLITTASYTNLSPGSYTFEVQASNNEGAWNTKGASVEIIVKPPFYMTVYAYLFYGLSALAVLLYVRRRGIEKLHRKFREEEQQREVERNKEVDQMKIKFLTNLSHEFRTPISLILAPLDNLLNLTGAPEFTLPLQAIKRNTRRLLNLVDQLLDLRNLQEQELKLSLNRGEIVSFVRETCESFRDLSHGKGITFIFDSKVDALYMHFDADKIERVLLNLLSNAFKFTAKGGEVRLELTSVRDDKNQEWFYIKIADTGIGIPTEQLDRIFDRFFQDETRSTVLNQGSGIGLSIVKEFVQMHNGFVRVESQEGRGSIFTVELPCSRSAETKRSQPIQHDPVAVVGDAELETSRVNPNQEQRDQTASILVVEDNEEFRHYLVDNLKAFYRVFEASDGKEGWQQALAHHPELIVSDISMPQMDGIELSQKIKSDKRTSHIPLMLLTASTGEEQQLRGLNSGANDYLTKPFNFDILNAKIHNLLLLNRLLKQVYSKHISISGSDTPIESGDEKLVKDILQYIEDNLNNTQLSVENLSKHVGMSRGTLYNKVLEITGQTPVEFIRSVKLEKAAILLEKSDMNVSQISYTAGFATPNYFAKSFKAKFNMLPSEYKNLKRREMG